LCEQIIDNKNQRTNKEKMFHKNLSSFIADAIVFLVKKIVVIIFSTKNILLPESCKHTKNGRQNYTAYVLSIY